MLHFFFIIIVVATITATATMYFQLFYLKFQNNI